MGAYFEQTQKRKWIAQGNQKLAGEGRTYLLPSPTDHRRGTGYFEGEWSHDCLPARLVRQRNVHHVLKRYVVCQRQKADMLVGGQGSDMSHLPKRWQPHCFWCNVSLCCKFCQECWDLKFSICESDPLASSSCAQHCYFRVTRGSFSKHRLVLNVHCSSTFSAIFYSSLPLTMSQRLLRKYMFIFLSLCLLAMEVRGS